MTAAPDDVYTLLVQVGRSEGDGLPDGSTGAAMLCYASGKDEKTAVDATVQSNPCLKTCLHR